MAGFTLLLFFIYPPIILDSAIYSIDIDKFEIQTLRFKDDVVDFVLDDFAYVMTNRYLYKIDQQNLSFVDYTLLPHCFNYITLNDNSIILIAANEIVTVDKSNLSFKAGMGIDYGDYRPINCGSPLAHHLIYLVADTDKKSLVKIFDLEKGRLLKAINLNRIITWDYDENNNTLMTVDIDNKLILYDINLNRVKTINLRLPGQLLAPYKNGFIMYNREGIFFINGQGELMDCQPLSIEEGLDRRHFLVLSKEGLVNFDTLTFRIKKFSPNTEDLVEILEIDEASDYAVAINGENDFFLININSLQIFPMTLRNIHLKPIATAISKKDSLWYFQLGAFNNYDHALAIRNGIREKGLPVFIDSIGLYRVKLGGFQDKANALEIISQANLSGWLVFQERIEVAGDSVFYMGSNKYILRDGIIKKE